MSSDLKQDILDSIDDINDLLRSYEILFSTIEQKEPDIIELAALGTVLHSFYNGVEGIFILIAKQIDKTTPSNAAWHQALLIQMTEKTSARSCVISLDIATLLAPYMKFRHFFRHAYSFMLDWVRLKPLVNELISTWDTVKEAFTIFCDTQFQNDAL